MIKKCHGNVRYFLPSGLHIQILLFFYFEEDKFGTYSNTYHLFTLLTIIIIIFISDKIIGEKNIDLVA